MEKKPEKGKPVPPGYDPVETTKKSSRRTGKRKDDPTKAGPSSNVPPPSAAQPGHEPGPSVQKPPTSIGAAQTPTDPVPAALSSKPTQTPRHEALASKNTKKGEPVAQLSVAQMSPAAVSRHQSTAGEIESENVPSAAAQSTASTENSQAKQTTSASSNAGQTAQEQKGDPKRPIRPGLGQRGIKAELFTNYFSLRVLPSTVLHHYSITVIPELKGKRLTQIINNAINLEQFDALRLGIATDFSHYLVSCQRLSQDESNVSVQVPMATGLNTDDIREAKHYAVWFSHIRKLDFSNLQSMEMNLADQEDLPVVQALDIVLGHHRKSSQDVIAVGKRKAFSTNPAARDTKLSNVLKAMQGFFSTVRLTATGPLVNINVSNSSFWEKGPLANVIRALVNDREINNTKIPALLRGLQVRLTHITEKTVIRSVSGYACEGDGKGYMLHPPTFKNDVLGPGPQDVLFFREKSSPDNRDRAEDNEGGIESHPPGCPCDGEYLSVAKHFTDRYGIRFDTNDNQLPVVNIGNQNHPAYVPLKVCEVLEQASKMKLNTRQTQAMQRFSVRTPDKNVSDIKTKAFATLGLLATNSRLTTFGLQVAQDLFTVSGRLLVTPTLRFRNFTDPGTTITKDMRQRSKWDLKRIKFMAGKALENWSCLHIFSGAQDEQDPTIYVTGLVKELKNCGIGCTKPEMDRIALNSINTAPGGICKLYEWFQTRTSLRFLLIILPNNSPDLYNHIKRLGDQDFGVLTCCVVAADDKFYNPNADARVQYNANVALKINLKLGGANHELVEGQLYKIKELENKTMVIGIDVTHPSVGSSENAPSIAAMVASDKRLSQWPADLRINKSREEMVGKLRSMLESRLNWWKAKYNDLPKNLLIYRDGVSEGQYQAVLDEELPQIRDACKVVFRTEYEDVEGQTHPKISLIVVGKRHHTRFIRKTKPGGDVDSSDNGKASNPEPGTVVDNKITQSVYDWDFFLQSHRPIFGTARPAHYFVLVDEIFRQWSSETIPKPFKNPAEILEQITYNMCCLFGRATTAVSIPPPVYYADIACERGRRYLSIFYDPKAKKLDTSKITDWDVEVHDDLKDKMFYI